MTTRASLTRAAGLAAVALVLAGCASWPTRGHAEDLREAADSLLPPAASVVVREEADCVELARSPSCVHLYFVTRRGSLEQRVATVERGAGRAGWTRERRELLPGGASLRYARDDLTAVVYLWREARAAPCRRRPEKDCADAIFVERGF